MLSAVRPSPPHWPEPPPHLRATAGRRRAQDGEAPAPVLTGLALLQEEEEQEEEDDDEDDDDTDDLDELDTDQLLEAELEEDENNGNAGEDGDNDFSPSDEELANLLEEGEEGEDEDSEADEEVELILGDSECGGAARRPSPARGREAVLPGGGASLRPSLAAVGTAHPVCPPALGGMWDAQLPCLPGCMGSTEALTLAMSLRRPKPREGAEQAQSSVSSAQAVAEGPCADPDGVQSG